MFFRRLSRSRSNSQSYVDNPYLDNPPRDSKANSASYDDQYVQSPHDYGDDKLPPPSRQSTANANTAKPRTSPDKETGATAMYPRQSQPQEVAYAQSNSQSIPSRPGSMPNSYGPPRGGASAAHYDSGSPSTAKNDAAPDLLLKAFNQALQPYTDKVDNLEAEIADLRAYIEQLEQHKTEIHQWIDKRGLRPDVPPNIARQMDASSHESSSTHAAATLNAQLDRKITIVNFDLHRLQDDLNDSLPTPSFSACMLKFLPDIARLSSLPSGPKYAFDLLLKLGGNLNSHGGLENGDEEDLAERRAFYGRLDEAMVDVVRGRFREEGDSWGVQREIKRIEKTGAYLRNWGVEPYFPRTLEIMRQGTGHSTAGATSPPTYS